MKHNRGQAYALEGIIGAIIVVSALVLGLQAVDIAPWTGNDERQNTERRAEVADMLSTAQDSGALKEAITCVNQTGQPHPDVAATEDGSSALGETLAQTIAEQYNYRISIEYPTGSGIESVEIGPTPTPPETATVSVSQYVVLTDSDPIYEVDRTCQLSGTELDEGSIYIDDEGSGSVYAVVNVRVIAW